MSERVRDAGFDDWLDAVAEGEGYYLRCPNEHGSFPPRRACPHCGSQDLTDVPLPETGVVETFTVVHVPTPDFTEDCPYATAVVDFGDARLTGQLTGVALEDVEVGMSVEPSVAETETTGDRILVFGEH